MVLNAEMVLKKSATIQDGTLNGGKMGTATITSGVRHAVFPKVTRSERVNGKVRYRKIFLHNINSSLETAYAPMIYPTFPSPAGDRFRLTNGTQTNTEAELTAGTPAWQGCGQLNTAVTAGDLTIAIAMENPDAVFERNGYLHISNQVLTGQTIAQSVRPGDSVTYSTGTWIAANHNGDTVYPNGIYLGSNTVQTDNGTGTEEWLQIADVATPYTYAGSICTVQLQQAPANNYATANSYAGGCVIGTDLVALASNYAKTSSGGTYDTAVLSVAGNNVGTIADSITVTFTGTGLFSVAGTIAGSLGSGSVSSSFSPINPVTSTPYFTIPSGFFTGTWINGDICTFTMTPSAMPLWIQETIPASTAANSDNFFALGYYWE